MSLQSLPLDFDVESKLILKQTNKANKALAELKGIVSGIPNPAILINTLALQEAKNSTAVENMITTHDDLYKAEVSGQISYPSIKEVQNYVEALLTGYKIILENQILRENDIKNIQAQLENNHAGYRRVPGTVLKNDSTGETIYTPPQDNDTITKLMSNLVQYINDDTMSSFDPLVKMAIIHHQFESTHPFYDGNGRTGRIINVLYLVMNDLLNLPILYLSRYIIKNKSAYYELFQEVHQNNNWEDWILYMVEGVEEIAKETIFLVQAIRQLMLGLKHKIRTNHKFYSQDLLNNLFKHPYTKIEFVEQDLQVSRITAGNYLNALADSGILTKYKLGNINYYVNNPLVDLLSQN